MIKHYKEPLVNVLKYFCHMRLIILIICTALLACADKVNTTPVVIANATVIDIHTGAKLAKDILIEEGRISSVQPHGTFDTAFNETLKNANVIDATGRYVIPGLWDMHVHMNYILELPDDWMSPLFIANGVTSVRDMGGELDNILALQKNFKQPGVIAPHLWIAGPVFDGSPNIFNGRGLMKVYPTMPKTPIDTPQAAIEFVDHLATSGVNFIKPYEMLRPEVFSAMAKRAHEHGLRVDGHVPQRMTITEAIAAGMDGVVHLKGTDYGCARDPEVLKAERVAILDQADEEEDALSLWKRINSQSIPKAMAQQDPERCEALIQLFVETDTWHTPGISTEAFLSKSEKELSQYEALRYVPAVAKAVKQADYKMLKSGEHAKNTQHMVAKYVWKQQLINKMHKAGVKLLAGTDSPALLLPGFSLHAELEALVQAGLSPLAALQAATINPARFFNVESEQGSIDIGKLADIVILDSNPLVDINNTRSIHAVISRGRVFDRSALDALRNQYVSPN